MSDLVVSFTIEFTRGSATLVLTLSVARPAVQEVDYRTIRDDLMAKRTMLPVPDFVTARHRDEGLCPLLTHHSKPIPLTHRNPP